MAQGPLYYCRVCYANGVMSQLEDYGTVSTGFVLKCPRCGHQCVQIGFQRYRDMLTNDEYDSVLHFTTDPDTRQKLVWEEM